MTLQNQNSKTFGLAPMEGVTDFPARLWFQLTGAPASCGTPFLRVTDSYPAFDKLDESIWPELFWARDKVRYKVVPQLMASDPVRFGKIAREVLRYSDVVEMNCGCPAPKVVGNGAGSSILRDPEGFAESLRIIGEHIPTKNLSVKIRTGFSDASDYPEMISALSSFALNRLVIHGRTRFQHYTGRADWEKIEDAARTTPYTVVGSGDITDRRSAQVRLHENSQVNGAIIGRGALRNPWVFRELREGIDTTVTRDDVIYALATYGLLMQAYRFDLVALRRLIDSGYFRKAETIASGSWQEAYRTIQDHLQAGDPDPFVLDMPRSTLGRVKMMWNALRSSLPASAMEPTILRSRSVGELLQAIGKNLPNQCTLGYDPAHDWIYAGQKRAE